MAGADLPGPTRPGRCALDAILQGVALSPLAANGLFASTDAHRVTITP